MKNNSCSSNTAAEVRLEARPAVEDRDGWPGLASTPAEPDRCADSTVSRSAVRRECDARDRSWPVSVGHRHNAVMAASATADITARSAGWLLPDVDQYRAMPAGPLVTTKDADQCAEIRLRRPCRWSDQRGSASWKAATSRWLSPMTALASGEGRTWPSPRKARAR